MVDKITKAPKQNELIDKVNEVIDNLGTCDSALSTTSTNPVQNKVITDALSKKVENKATNASSVSILGNANANDNSVNIGTGSTGVAYSVSVGYNATSQNYGTAVGYNSNATTGAIQLGAGTNNTQNTFKVKSWEMLDASGKIPNDRINTTIARVTDIPDISEKQDILISGENIKTVNGNSLLGSGDVNISIPTVNNAEIEIQKNSTKVGSFTTNQGGNKQTINITVPTTASDVGALPNSTKYGSTIDVALSTTDYKQTITLKDQDGNTLSSKVVDFPVESMVVSGTFDSTNKKIVLTLQNGTTTDIPVGKLIAGLQTEITSSNKLSADLISDGTTNKTVTQTEKNTWNNKQNALSSTNKLNPAYINTSSSYRFVTDTEKSNWNSKQDALGYTPCRKYSVSCPALSAQDAGVNWIFDNPTGSTECVVFFYEGNTQVFPPYSVSTTKINVGIASSTNVAAGDYRAVIIG